MRVRRALLVGVALVSCTTGPAPRGLFPDPLEPPVPPPPLTRSQTKAAREVAALLAAARLADASRKLEALPANHAARELLQLERALAAGEANLWPAVVSLTQRFPQYRPAWRLAVLVAEREGLYFEAAEAAEQLAQLVSGEPWHRRRDELLARALRQAEERVASLLQAGQAGEAADQAQALLARFPERRSVRELAVRAALAAGKVEQAKLLVLSLPEDEAGLEMKAEVAASEERWEVAVALLRRLPPHHPGRCSKLRQAEEQARWQKASPLAREARESGRLTRAQLASLLTFYFPLLAAKAQGPVPLFEDLVGVPQQADALVVVRAGLMAGDPLTRRFAPRRVVTGAELSKVLERLVEVLQVPGVNLCGNDGSVNDCLAVPSGKEEVSGKEAAALFARLWELLPC